MSNGELRSESLYMYICGHGQENLFLYAYANKKSNKRNNNRIKKNIHRITWQKCDRISNERRERKKSKSNQYEKENQMPADKKDIENSRNFDFDNVPPYFYYYYLFIYLLYFFCNLCRNFEKGWQRIKKLFWNPSIYL